MRLNTIFGAPGCGKTYRLMDIMSTVLGKYNPEEIAFVSFTNKGVNEGIKRISKLFGYKKEQLPYCGTIHAMSNRNIEDKGREFFRPKDYKKFSKETGLYLLGYYTEDFQSNDDKYLHTYNVERNTIGKENHFLYNDIDYRKLQWIKECYKEFKKVNYLKDFEDCVEEFIKQGKSLPVKIAFIDEAQDLTPLQWKFCRVAFKDCKKVYLAGDDDQALYEWRGASVKDFLHWANNSDMEVLEKSYRLNRKVLNYSNRLVHLINNRVEKKFEPVGEYGNIYYYSSFKEIDINNEESYYLLSRNRMFLKQYKDVLRERGMVYTFKKKSSIVNSVDKNLYKAIMLYELYRKKEIARLRSNKSILLRLKPEIARNVNNIEKFPKWFRAFELTLEEEDYYRTLFQNKIDIEECNCLVSTIHGVKGGEADNVVLTLDITKNVHNALQYKHGHEAELRCLYVALTRARKNLHIVFSQGRLGYDYIIQGVRYD
jgi:superfamily I DNA/RNA helicase